VRTCLTERLVHVARAFRRGEHGEANDALAEAVDALVQILEKNPSGIPIGEISRVLRGAFEAQRRGDFLFVADCLEHELAPLVSDAALHADRVRIEADEAELV
jgi:hypothetical protein